MIVPVAVVGGGPAGLRAAEAAACTGVHLFDAMPSVGRKFLVAGRGGLNITNAEPMEDFLRRYTGGEARWPELLADLGPQALREWVGAHGVGTFVGSGRKVYPDGMKSAPLLRRWVATLRAAGIHFHPRHRLVSLERSDEGWRVGLLAPGGAREVLARAVVLALGGASWPATGSDAQWVSVLAAHGVGIRPLVASNCGWDIAWPGEVRESLAGQPLKNIAVTSGGVRRSGEIVLTRNGLEGGPVYALAPQIRATGGLSLDLKPAWTFEKMVERLGAPKRLHPHEAFSRWRLDATARSLVSALLPPDPAPTAEGLAAFVKDLPCVVTGPRPIAEAISSAGGVAWDELNDDLMLHKLPGVFVAGEMIDWEAPTGGYLMQGCFATGLRAGAAAARFAT